VVRGSFCWHAEADVTLSKCHTFSQNPRSAMEKEGQLSIRRHEQQPKESYMDDGQHRAL